MAPTIWKPSSNSVKRRNLPEIRLADGALQGRDHHDAHARREEPEGEDVRRVRRQLLRRAEAREELQQAEAQEDGPQADAQHREAVGDQPLRQARLRAVELRA